METSQQVKPQTRTLHLSLYVHRPSPVLEHSFRSIRLEDTVKTEIFDRAENRRNKTRLTYRLPVLSGS